MRFSFKLFLLVALPFVITGCERYAQKPLQSEQILGRVERVRHLPDAALPDEYFVSANDPLPAIAPVEFSFMRSVELMKKHSPSLKELRSEYSTAQALAAVKTPFPNPAFEAGPMYGFGPDVSKLHRLQPFGSLGFAIPTGQRLKRQDELNQALAGQAYVETEAKQRELYLELRKNYTSLALSQMRIDRRKQLAESAEKSTSITKKMIEIGQMTALDVGLIELEQARLKIEIFSAKSQQVNVRGELSQLVGVHAEHFTTLPADPLPKLPEKLPTLPELQKIMLNNSPELARLRARYEVAERQLHLEISKQYPDFKIGPSFDRERGERKTNIGLTLGIDIPIFDHNQQAITVACNKREEIRIKFEAAANRALAMLDRAFANTQLASEKLGLLNTLLLPQVNSNIELSRKALETGVSDILKFLEAERNQRTVLLDTLETELLLRSAWVELEQAVGYPLAIFPNESDVPPLSESVQSISTESKCNICKENVK